MDVIDDSEFTLLVRGLVEKMQLVRCLIQSPDGTLDVAQDKALTIIKAVEKLDDDEKQRLAKTIDGQALKREARLGLHFSPGRYGDAALQLKAEAASALLILIIKQLNLRVFLAG